MTNKVNAMLSLNSLLETITKMEEIYKGKVLQTMGAANDLRLTRTADARNKEIQDDS